MFEIEKEKHGIIIILKFRGNMLIEDAVNLQIDLENIIINCKTNDLALDLANVDQIDNTGLGAVVGAQATGRVNGKRLMLYRPNEKFMNLLEELELSGFFPMLEDNDDLMGRSALI